MKTIICLDFDGVLNLYDGNYVCDELIPTGPVPGAREWCWDIWNSDKADLIVSSGRCRNPVGIAAIQKWLDDWDFPPMPISPVKPVAHVYIDDRAYRFNGDWKSVDVEEFIKFRAWWDDRYGEL